MLYTIDCDDDYCYDYFLAVLLLLSMTMPMDWRKEEARKLEVVFVAACLLVVVVELLAVVAVWSCSSWSVVM